MKTEKQTRKEIIDHRLTRAGWNLSDGTQIIEEFNIEIQRPSGLMKAKSPNVGHQFSDYVLLGRDGKPLAVVEAKRTSVDALVVQESLAHLIYSHSLYGPDTRFLSMKIRRETILVNSSNLGKPSPERIGSINYNRINSRIADTRCSSLEG